MNGQNQRISGPRDSVPNGCCAELGTPCMTDLFARPIRPARVDARESLFLHGVGSACEATVAGVYSEWKCSALRVAAVDCLRDIEMNRPLSRVTVEIELQNDDLGTDADDDFVALLEAAIQKRLASAPKAGKWDGHEFGAGWAIVYCYGRDGALLSDLILDAILPVRQNRQLRVTGSFGEQPDNYQLVLSRVLERSEVNH